MKKYKLYQVDSFTRNKFYGNPAGVVPNVDGLSDEQMQKIARELNNSETAFIFSSASPEYDKFWQVPKPPPPGCLVLLE